MCAQDWQEVCRILSSCLEDHGKMSNRENIPGGQIGNQLNSSNTDPSAAPHIKLKSLVSKPRLNHEASTNQKLQNVPNKHKPCKFMHMDPLLWHFAHFTSPSQTSHSSDLSLVFSASHSSESYQIRYQNITLKIQNTAKISSRLTRLHFLLYRHALIFPN